MIPHVYDLRAFEMSEDRGFLPHWDPVDQLPPWFSAWDEMGRELPKLLMTDWLRPALEKMPTLDFSQLESRPDRERAMMLLSYFGHAYVWGGGEVAKRLPASISIPWSRASEYLGRPPVLSYASYALNNWRRIDPHGPVALGNIVLHRIFSAAPTRNGSSSFTSISSRKQLPRWRRLARRSMPFGMTTPES